jgi:hypothetical protein
VNLGSGSLKFVESSTFRALRSPADLDNDALMLGSVLEIAGVAWRIAGSAANPHRRDETLVFVEIIHDRREAKQYRRRASDHR